MPFTLSEEEALIQKVVREFAAGVGLEKASDFDRFDRFPIDVIQQAAVLGLTTLSVPAEAGGAGAGPTAFAVACYELAQICPNSAAILAAHNAALHGLLASPQLAAGVVTKAAAGETMALLVAEEAYGSETSRAGTLATPAGEGYSITGQKVWAIGASDAKHFLVLATVPKKGPTMFLVADSAAGVSRGENEPLLGLRAAGIRTVYFSAVNVPASAVVGEVGNGLVVLASTRPWLQVGAAAALAGCVAGGLSAAARFAETRVQFGAAIGTYQAVSDGVTAMDLQLAASRALVFEAAAHLGQEDEAVWAARAKAFAADIAVPMTRQAIRVQGGTGFMREGGTERFARDARALQFVGETGHMQRDLLKRHLMPGVQFPATP